MHSTTSAKRGKTINITVQLHTILQHQSPEGRVRRLQVSLSHGSCLAKLLDQLEIELDSDALLLVVNGRLAEPDHVLREGDQVNLMPAISGGIGLQAVHQSSKPQSCKAQNDRIAPPLLKNQSTIDNLQSKINKAPSPD